MLFFQKNFKYSKISTNISKMIHLGVPICRRRHPLPITTPLVITISHNTLPVVIMKFLSTEYYDSDDESDQLVVNLPARESSYDDGEESQGISTDVFSPVTESLPDTSLSTSTRPTQERSKVSHKIYY